MTHRLTAIAWYALAALAALTASACLAETFPAKPVTIIVPYPPGGSIDNVARPLANKLQKMWGQPVIVENRPGANGMLATMAVVRSPPDGYTLLYHITGIIQNPLLYKNVSYDPLKDVTPVIQVGSQAMALAVSAKSALGSVDQLAADGKVKGAKGHVYGSVGIGHTGHIWSELLVSEKKFQATHAPYKGGGSLVIDLTSDRLDWAFLSTAEAIVRFNDKSLKMLAVTGTERVKQMPEIATLRELGYPGFEMVGWHGLFAAAGTPKAIVAKLESDMRTALADPELEKVLEFQAIRGTSLGSDDFGKLMRSDQARWATFIKRFNIQAD